MVTALQYIARPAMKRREADREGEVERQVDCGFSGISRQETQLAVLETARRTICIIQDWGLLSYFLGSVSD